ncbi:MAG: hypothetical protein FWD53_03510 [Phycisphaerales bacterium]|nr:hypothetical protein [Phycisphaerales bacterium]
MDKKTFLQLHSSFEAMVLKDVETGVGCWYARDLLLLLGYTQWRSFEGVIQKAISACQDPANHFARARKIVDLGSAAQREIEDIAPSRELPDSDGQV